MPCKNQKLAQFFIMLTLLYNDLTISDYLHLIGENVFQVSTTKKCCIFYYSKCAFMAICQLCLER